MLFYVYSNQTVQDKLMKINRMLIAVLAMLAVVLSSCKDDDAGTERFLRCSKLRGQDDRRILESHAGHLRRRNLLYSPTCQI